MFGTRQRQSSPDFPLFLLPALLSPLLFTGLLEGLVLLPDGLAGSVVFVLFADVEGLPDFLSATAALRVFTSLLFFPVLAGSGFLSESAVLPVEAGLTLGVPLSPVRALILAAGLSLSVTLTGVLSFILVSELAACVASGALSVSTRSGCPGLLSDFIEIPLASCSCANDILNLSAMLAGFSPGCTV